MKKILSIAFMIAFTIGAFAQPDTVNYGTGGIYKGFHLTPDVKRGDPYKIAAKILNTNDKFFAAEVDTLNDGIVQVKSTGDITASVGITVAQQSRVMLANLSAARDITASPQIAAGVNGQIITIIGQSDTNTLTLDDGTGLFLKSNAQCVLGDEDTITLIYITAKTGWVELTRSMHAP